MKIYNILFFYIGLTLITSNCLNKNLDILDNIQKLPSNTSITKLDNKTTSNIIILGEGSTEIVEEAHKDKTFTKIVKIADSVTRFIGNGLTKKNPFNGVTFEQDLILQSNLPTLGDNNNHPFVNTIFKGKIIFPNNITSIGTSAFSKAIFHAPIILPNTLTSISDAAFWKATFHYALTLPNNITSIKNFTFYEATFHKALTLPANLTSISDAAFSKAIFHTALTLPNTLTTIKIRTFEKAIFHAPITLPNTLISIGGLAFNQAKLPSGFKIPNSVATNIGADAFKDVILPTNHRWSGNPTNNSNYVPKAGDEIIAKTP